MDDSDDQSSSDEYSLDEEINGEELFVRDLQRVRNNDPGVDQLCGHGAYDIFQNMTNEEWEDIGRNISNLSNLVNLEIIYGALDDEKLSSMFRGLTKSSSIVNLELDHNEFSAAGLMSLEPFLQNSINLRKFNVSHTNIQTDGFNILLRALRGNPIEILCCRYCGITSIEIETIPNNLQLMSLVGNNIQSEGFNRLLRSLSDSSIGTLYCSNCGIESIEIDTDSFPRNLNKLVLAGNRIDSNGCHEIAKLLQEENLTLGQLHLSNNFIGDEGAAILADALKTNTTLKWLTLGNNDISRSGRIKMLELVNDISSINATLQSNHTLQTIDLGALLFDDISPCIGTATTCNKENPLAAGRQKVIQTQLHSKRRAELVEIQGVRSQSVYGEINPLHLPEVLSLGSRTHGQGELFIALKASIAGVLSTVNRKLCLQQKRAHHVAIVEEIDAAIAAIESAEGEADDVNESRGNKRPRV